MKEKFNEYKQLDLTKINKDILEQWKTEDTFQKSIESRKNNERFVFYEGPPSANGTPGIHHVISRTIKDIICRYKTIQGYCVERKAGWDTHGLPVELSVEKVLNITKEDIGKKISVEEYNNTCRQEVMKFTDIWADLTDKMGYWINMDDPYITYDNRYIETVWYLLKELFNKDLLYKGYTIQPYSPAAGTGLSSHELNQPGCYRDVKDTTVVAQFEIIQDEQSRFLFEDIETGLYILAWTTTPWTLPSNTALAVGKDLKYLKVRTFNVYTGQPITVILSKDRFAQYFNPKNKKLALSDYNVGDKKVPYEVIGEYGGQELAGLNYHQLINWVTPQGKAFKVVTGDFVTTEEGTGIVHIAPTFGEDDYKISKQYQIAPLIVYDKNQQSTPLVDKAGRFFPVDELDEEFVKNHVNLSTYKNFEGRYVKNEYDDNLTGKDPSVDVDISVMLKKENKAFQIEKYVHNYPHCWRTDKPVLYYPLDSWFIKSTAKKDRLIELNNTINWKPESTGTGRFGKWLENLVDWNLSRSRYWGTPLPIWVSEDRTDFMCIGSVKELKDEIDKSVTAGYMENNPLERFVPGNFSDENYNLFDLHRPFVDNIILVSENGKPMYREQDLIDVWFDSGAMPYAQLHYPFENKDLFDSKFPADFIAEGVDQTRGWFFTLHAIAGMLFDSVAYKNIISNGLVLDKNGNKMSKRLGNVVDPFNTIEQFGADAVRWYMITNAQPWDNLKFDTKGVDETRRKFFGTLYNTYSFFSLYANVDGFRFEEEEIPMHDRPEIDRWILSLLNTLIKEVRQAYDNYEPTRAGRLIQNFVIEDLSNWYVRLNRKRFWGGEYNRDKIAAYQTLYSCLETVAILTSPVAPFYSDLLFRDLVEVSGKYKEESVHLVYLPDYNQAVIDKDLEEQMLIAQKVSSMILSLRRKVNLKVRQPLSKILVPIVNNDLIQKFENVKSLILTEVNVKDIEYITDTSGILIKKIKPNYKMLGPRFGKNVKNIATYISDLSQEDITKLENEGQLTIRGNGEEYTIHLNEVEIVSEDIPGWLVTSDGKLTVALDIKVSEELRQEGVARELVNRIQNLRKESGFEVTDKINIKLLKHQEIDVAVENYKDYICEQTLAQNVELVNEMKGNNAKKIELDDEIHSFIAINKLQSGNNF